ncbi:MAG: hypothetical protein Q4G42_01615 [Neisseria sp.]|nr:hypothetical protein [Neisseria sp.]
MNKYRDFLDFIDFIPKLLLITINIGVIFGGMVTLSYLSNIGQKSFFTNVIGQSSSFIIISMTFAIFLLLFFIGFSVPYMIAYFLREDNAWTKCRKQCYYYLSFIAPMLFSAFIFSLYALEIQVGWLMTLAVWLNLIIPAVLYFCLKNKESDLITVLSKSFYMPMAVFFTNIFLILMFASMAGWFGDDSKQWIFFLLSIFYTVLVVVVAGLILPSQDSSKDSESLIFSKIILIPTVLTIFYLVSSMPWVDNFPQRMLYPARFVELPQNSNWYLISYDFEKRYGGIEKFKTQFTCDNNNNSTRECASNMPRNALYGYMAWNIGSTKIFCPKSADFNDKNKAEQSKQCLWIDEKLLQKIDFQYIVDKNKMSVVD